MQNIKKEIYYNDKSKKYSNQIVLSNKSMQNNTNAVFLQKGTHTLSFTQQTHSFNLQFFAEKDSTQKKKKYLPLIISLIVLIALALASIPVISIVTKKDTKAFKYDDTTNYVEVGEIWDSEAKVFNSKNLNTLISYLSTGYTSDADITATDIRGYTANGKTSSQAVVVTLGGLKWQVVYLTQVNGQRVATLWLTNNEQDAFVGRSSTEGSYYGYLQGHATGKTGLYSGWSAGWRVGDNGWSDEFPSGMYGTSYIRAVTLNNGGIYATSSTTSETAIQNPDSAFAQFTVSEEGAYNDLTDFIVKPNAVNYQMESQYGKGEFNYDLMNDSLATDLTGYYTKSDGTECNFQGNAYYTNWGSDNLWLPSIQETGYRGVGGIWQVNMNERMNYDSISFGKGNGVESANGSTISDCWLRSSQESGYDLMILLLINGDSYAGEAVSASCAVRPALHLNLESAVLNAPPRIEATTNIKDSGVVTIEATYSELGAPYVVEESEVTITATQNLGYIFEYWMVNGTKITSNSYTFTITEATTAVANFRECEINITSPDTSLDIKITNGHIYKSYFITPTTSNLYIYSIQVNTNEAQIFKSRRGLSDYSGASAYIQYNINEDNQQLALEIMNITNDIDITLSYIDTNQNLPEILSGVTGTTVTATEGGEARIVGNDIANGEDTDTVTFVAIAYTGYSFAGWVNANDETEIFGTADQKRISLTKAEIDGKIIKALFTPKNS